MKTSTLKAARCFVWAAAGMFLFSGFVFAAEPDNYYNAARGKSGYELKTALHNIIKSHTQLSYAALWSAYQTTDTRPDGKIWDMYSDCEFIYGQASNGGNQCTTDNGTECLCYNREHSFPKSWFGGEVYPMYTDLHHIYPTDGYINKTRGNYPFGEVTNPTVTFEHSSAKFGNNTFGSAYRGKSFEPADEYKGDFARTYFYMATCYEDKIAYWDTLKTTTGYNTCEICNGTSDQGFDDWTVAMLLKWHKQDPVSEKETARNDAVYALQKNRNPFIDHPELVEKIWGDDNTAWSEDPTPDPGEDPNPNPGQTSSDSILLVEDFAAFSGSDGNSTAETDFSDCANVQDGWWAKANSGIRMSSNNTGCIVTFKTFDYNGVFNVVIDGKGYSASKRTATLICSECVDTSKTLTFTHYKGEEDYGDGVYETLEPIEFTTKPGKSTVTLKVSAAGGKQIFLGKITAINPNPLVDTTPAPVDTTQKPDPVDPTPTPDPNPDPGEEVETSLYYQPALGKARYELKTALFNIIKTHDTLKYDDLWEAFKRTDRRADGYVWDFYTNCDLGFDIHVGAAECGGINREHSFPKSWFGCGAGNEDKDPAATDLHHLYPTDAYYNSRHNNNPYAEVETSTARFISSNGTKDGYSITDGYTGRAFEVIDEYKGDIARTYFYMMTAYQDRTAGWKNTCPVCNGTSTQGFSDWYVTMLLKWHQLDPVSDKERARNDSVYKIQHNRNPFIDHPELVDKIWGGDQTPFGQAVDIWMPYVYKDEQGNVLRRDTVFVTHPVDNTDKWPEVEDDAQESDESFVPATLLNETFHLYTRTDASNTTISDRIPETLDSVSGIVYEGCNGVRLGRGDTIGALHFKPVPYQGSFKLLINGKGFNATKLTATVNCKECEVKEKTVRFTRYKGSENSDSTLAVDFYETAEPIYFNTEAGAETVTLTIAAAKGKQVFIGRVQMVSMEEIYRDPTLYVETTYWDSVAVEKPLAADKLQNRALGATVKLIYKGNSKMMEKAITLPKIGLEWNKNYTLDVSLYNNQNLLDSQTVNFSTDKGPQPPMDTVAAPVFAPAGGSDTVFADSVKVSLTCATADAQIYYSVDNMASIEPYSAPIVLYESDEVEAFAVKEDMIRSAVVNAVYTIVKTPDPVKPTVATPLFTPMPDEDTVFADSVVVVITCDTADADIFYSLDGTRPYIPYSELTTLIFRENTTLRALASKEGYQTSDVAVAYYRVEPRPELPHDTIPEQPHDTSSHDTVIVLTKLPAPYFTPSAADTVFADSVLVSLSCDTADAEIVYSLDATTPTLVYSAPLKLKDTATLTAFARKEGCINSDTVRMIYYVATTAPDTASHDTIPNPPPLPPDTVKVSVPTFSIESGSVVENGTFVTLSCETEGALIYYGKGRDAVPETRFRRPLAIDADTTYFCALGLIAGKDTSEIVRAVYYIKKDTVPTPPVPLAVEAGKTLPIRIYPNPSKGEFTVEAPQGSTVEILSASGLPVERRVNVSGREKFAFRMPDGVYFVRVQHLGRSAVKRLILQ